MTNIPHNPRTPDADIDAMFLDRWSPRAMSAEPLLPQHVQALFEAARWAPSCYNEQPWLFLYAITPEDRQRFAAALVEKNRQWASRAPLLIFVATRRNFALNNKPNRQAAFDAGAAWMSLALQARKLGLYTHGMAGFDLQKAYEVTALAPDQYDILAAVAVGRRGDPALLPNDLRQYETPNNRKPPVEVARTTQPPTELRPQ